LFIQMNVDVKSATRVLDLLEFLSSQQAPVRLREIVQTLSFPKSSAHGLLMTLVSRGYVVKNAAGQYVLVEAFRSNFGWIGGFEARLKAVAMPIMQAASEESGETLLLSVPHGNGDARMICKVVSRQAIRYDVDDARPVVPGYATVMGRVLLAFSDPEFVNAYLARTELVPKTARSVTSRAKIRAILADIRVRGFGTIEEEYAVGGCGIAVPVHQADGKVAAVLNIATVTQRYTANRERLLDTVRAAAAQLDSRLGYRPRSMARTASDAQQSGCRVANGNSNISPLRPGDAVRPASGSSVRSRRTDRDTVSKPPQPKTRPYGRKP
jgi:DNA-binding IclR family transcriptional regulator